MGGKHLCLFTQNQFIICVSGEAVVHVGVYELVQQSTDSDYESDYNSEDEDSEDIFEKIANY